MHAAAGRAPCKTEPMLPRIAALLACALFLTGCSLLGTAPSPVTTYTDATGESVTVDWADYPAASWIDGELLLEAPDEKELEPTARGLVAAVNDAIAEATGIRLEPLRSESTWFDEDNSYPQQGNGYGGESMLTTINCCELQADRVPPQGEWQAVVDAASRAAAEFGLGPLRFDEIDGDCNGREGCWLWSATATDGVQWLALSISDAERDPSGQAQKDVEQFGWPPRTVSISYGATVVRAGAKVGFAEAMQPFLGLERPAATTSD